MSKRWKVIVWLWLIGYPFLAIAVSIMMTALGERPDYRIQVCIDSLVVLNYYVRRVGLLIAVFDSHDLLVQICGAFALAIPVAMAVGGWAISDGSVAREAEVRRWKNRIERRSHQYDPHRVESVVPVFPCSAEEIAQEKEGSTSMDRGAVQQENRTHITYGHVSLEVHE